MVHSYRSASVAVTGSSPGASVTLNERCVNASTGRPETSAAMSRVPVRRSSSSVRAPFHVYARAFTLDMPLDAEDLRTIM